jgi:hypothetical protein
MWYLLKVDALIAAFVFSVAGMMILTLHVGLKVKAFGAELYRLSIDVLGAYLRNFGFSRSGRAGYTAILLIALLWPAVAAAADNENDNSDFTSATSIRSVSGAPKAEKRMFGVLPNYRSVESSIPFVPLSARQKMSIAAHDSFDWPSFLTAGVYAGIYHAENQNPTLGQGSLGYSKRYTATLADQMIGNMMAEGFLPVLMHDDPRFFRSGTGSIGGRLKSAVRQIFTTRTDSGSSRLNGPKLLGNGFGVGISNLYYTDQRTISSNMQRFGLQIGMDTLSNLGKEFWPDIKERFFHK